MTDDRIKEALRDVGRDAEPDPAWQARVLAAIDRQDRLRRLVLVVVLLATAVALWIATRGYDERQMRLRTRQVCCDGSPDRPLACNYDDGGRPIVDYDAFYGCMEVP